MSAPILPGATIGILGSGQLGRMLALTARRMGYRVHTLSPDPDSPTGQAADREVSASYGDLDAIRAFAQGVQVVTFELENVPAAAARAAAEWVPVRPSPAVLETTQHRLRAQTFLAAAGLPVTPFRGVRTWDEMQAGLRALGYPAVLKATGFGYDGSGQVRVGRPEDAAPAFQELGGRDGLLEAFVDVAREISVVAARGVTGSMADYGVIANTYQHHILDLSVAPADVPPPIATAAVAIARAVLTALDAVGVLCVEFFLTRSGALLINEVAPRTHNSGHLTMDACLTGQFEQQLRAICGLPLGAPDQLRPAAMANLLGDLWQGGPPDWPAACALPGVTLHLYGKPVVRPGRKMGHLTALAATPEAAARQVLAARAALGRGTVPPWGYA